MNHNPMDDVRIIRRVAFYIGSAALIIAAFMSFRFGLSMSILHAALLGLLTLSGSILFPYAGHLRAAGNKNFITFVLIGSAFLGAEYFSHIGYSIGQRVMNTEQTDVQNGAYKIKQVSVQRNAAELSDLHAKAKEMKEALDWVGTVTPDGLRAQITPMDESIRQETARGGCGPKCLALTQEKAAIEDKIAAAERYNQINVAIAEHEKLVNSKENEAKVATFTSSPVVAQTKFVSQLATFELNPDESALTWAQIAIGALLALVTTFLAPTMFAIAWGPANYAEAVAGRAKPQAPVSYPAPLVTAAPVSVPQVTARAAPEPVPAPHYDFHLHGHGLDANGLLAALQRKIAEGSMPRAAAAA